MAKGKKTGGRTAGTPNKANQTLIEKCEGRGIDLFDKFLEIIGDDENDPNLRFQALKEAAQYVYPKRKAVEMALDPDKATIRVIFEDYTSKK